LLHNHVRHELAVITLLAKPDEHRVGAAVDAAHLADLVAFLGIVMLTYINGIGPWHNGIRVTAQMVERCLQIDADLMLVPVPVQQDRSRDGGIASGVQESFVLLLRCVGGNNFEDAIYRHFKIIGREERQESDFASGVGERGIELGMGHRLGQLVSRSVSSGQNV